MQSYLFIIYLKPKTKVEFNCFIYPRQGTVGMSGSSRVSEEEFELESDSGRLTDSTTYASHKVSLKISLHI